MRKGGAEVFHQRALREDRSLAAGFDIAEDQRVRAFAEVDALNVVSVARDIPPEVIARDVEALGEAAEGKVVGLIVIFHRRRGVNVGDEFGDLIGGVQAEIFHEIGSDRVDVHRHIFQRLLRARGRQGVVGRPARVALGGNHKRRKLDRIIGRDLRAGRSHHLCEQRGGNQHPAEGTPKSVGFECLTVG